MAQISVIVPIYKVEKYIKRCVDSILKQTFEDFELVLIDDGSPDKCGLICDEYKAKDERVVVIHQKNGGLSVARNAGIDWAFSNSDSRWLYFVDSDDWIHPSSFKILVDGAKQTGLDVIIGAYEKVQSDDLIMKVSKLDIDVWKTEEFYKKNTVTATTAWGKLYKKELFTDIRYPEGKNQEDEWATYKILFKNKDVAFVNSPLYYYFENPEGIMHTMKIDDIVSGLDAYCERITFLKKNKKNNLYAWQVRSYIHALAVYIVNENKYNFCEKDVLNLKIRLKNELCNKEVVKEIPFVETNMWIYKIVCPNKVKWFYYFRIIKILIKKLK